MAITLPQIKVSVNLGNIVDAAIEAVQAERKNKVARVEAEFQKAIADGLAYDEQISLRQRQLNEEETSGFPDSDYKAILQKSISDTKKLLRFNKYRTKYANTLAELSSGKINEESYLSLLKNNLTGVEDPDLRLEIQNDIAEAEKTVKSYRDTILNNQVKRAKFDGTLKSLDEALVNVRNARASAVISDNQDEVTAHDETISAIESQLFGVRVQDSRNDYRVQSATRGTSPVETLNFLNNELSRADANRPVRINNVPYRSAQEFWTLERDGYLAGTSREYGDFFQGLQEHSKNVIGSSTSCFGYPIQTVLDDVNSTFNSLGTRVEMQPYLNKFDATKASIMSDAVDRFAMKVTDAAEFSQDYESGVSQLQKVGQRYAVNTEFYISALLQKMRGLENARLIPRGTSERIAGENVSVELPEIDEGAGAIPGAPATPAQPVAGGYSVKAGDTLSAIAARAGLSLPQLLDLNPEFKANPNLIKPGQNVKLSATPTIPTETPPVTPPKPEEKPVPTPTSTPTPSVTSAPGATPSAAPKVPVPQTPATPVPPKSTSTTYVIKSGDTLSGIAQKLLGDASRYKELATLNNIKDPNKIFAGATINLPL